jgi:hypothetical protein
MELYNRMFSASSYTPMKMTPKIDRKLSVLMQINCFKFLMISDILLCICF